MYSIKLVELADTNLTIVSFLKQALNNLNEFEL